MYLYYVTNTNLNKKKKKNGIFRTFLVIFNVDNLFDIVDTLGTKLFNVF